MTITTLLYRCRTATVGLLAAAALAACGGGGGGDSGGGSGGGGSGGGGGSNGAPTASAGPDLNVLAGDFVRLGGSGSDPDSGDTLTYAWSQLAGPAVTISGAASANASFIAPGGGGGGGASVTVSGELKYEFVPPNPLCRGLNYTAIQERPIRRATVQALDQSNPTVLTFRLTVSDGSGATGTDEVRVQVGDLLATGTADDNGLYQLQVPADTSVSLRVRAELKDFATPGWDVEVRDNTQLTSNPLAARPLYVLDGTTFDSGSGTNRSLTATTGWDGTAYTAPRAAAPFAVLDAIYTAMRSIRAVDANAHFPPLDVFWSINNTTAQGSGSSNANIDSGEIGTSFYRSDLDALFLLGKANDDTEEFDDHVIVHEWGHYFEDVFSRSDSIGGSHGFGDLLDMRLAFGEGWATALSGIALEDPVYCDTQGQRQANGFDIDIESDSESSSAQPRGWFNEFSVMGFVYDLWDVSPGELTAGDQGSIGFGPIYNTMVNRQATTAAHTSIFSFADLLVQEDPGSFTLVDSLRNHHDINGNGIYGDGETNVGDSANGGQDVLPIYTDVEPNGVTVQGVCSSRANDPTGSAGNKLAAHRYLRMTITVPSRYEFDIVTDQATRDQLPPDDPGSAIDQSDPDLLFFLDGVLQNRVVNGSPQGLSGEANRENFTTPNVLQPGDYVMDLVEFRHEDEDTDQSAFPARSCFDITVRPAP